MKTIYYKVKQFFIKRKIKKNGLYDKDRFIY